MMGYLIVLCTMESSCRREQIRVVIEKMNWMEEVKHSIPEGGSDPWQSTMMVQSLEF